MKLKSLPITKLGFAAWLSLGLCALGCGAAPSTTDGGTAAGDGGTTSSDGGAKKIAHCNATEYVAFDPNNHAPQDLRLAKIDEMLKLFSDAETTPTDAAAKSAAIKVIYEATDAQLSGKVAGRKDVHDGSTIGTKLDQTIRGAIAELAAATTKTKVQIAKQKFEKAGLNRWLYLSVLNELYASTKKNYDEAYGYLGTGSANAEAGRKSMARIATKRDGNNGTTLAAELFVLLNDGACALETALDKKGATSMAKDDDPEYARVVKSFDDKMQLALVYSVGHELFELNARKSDANAAMVKLYEGDGYFQIVEPYLKAAGGAKAQLSTDLRAAYDAAVAKAAAGDATWVSELKATELLGKLETAFAIKIKG